MKRKLIDKLILWKNSSHRKPLFLLGASGVGKSYLAYDFGKSFYQHMIYLDLSLQEEVTKEWLEGQIPFEQAASEAAVSKEITIRNTVTEEAVSEGITASPVLLIMDNVRWNIHSKNIKEFFKAQQDSERYDILLLSNYWTPSYGKGLKAAYLTLYPLDFEEFLLATGNGWYVDSIKNHYNSCKKLPDIVHNELLDLFHTFLTIGGMPLVINEYISSEGTYNIRRQHKLLYQSFLYQLHYNQTESKNLDIPKAEHIFQTIPAQLLKENQKFKFSLIKKGATANKYHGGIQHLQYSYYSIPCYRINDEESMNVTSALSEKNLKYGFKLYQSDVGLLHTAMWEELPALERDMHNIAVMKALFDNHVAITLASKGHTLKYWESNSQAKMDFVLMKNKELIPIEVKPTAYTRSKGFSVFKEQYPETKELIKLSTRNFGSSNQVKFVPIYAAFCI